MASLGATSNAENKLFIGGAPPGTDEETLKKIFSEHGEVEEVFVMRGGSRSGQACAFIRFTTAEGAIAAIQAIHGKYVMPGCSDPLVVRYADAPGSRVKRGPTRGAAAGLAGSAGYAGMGFACGYPGGGTGGFAAGGAGCYGGPPVFGPMGGGGGMGSFGQMGQMGGYGGAGAGDMAAGCCGGMGAAGMPLCCGGHMGGGGCAGGMGSCGGGGCASGMGGAQLAGCCGQGCCAAGCGMPGQCCCAGQCGMGAGGSAPTWGLLNTAGVGSAMGTGAGLGGLGGLGASGLVGYGGYGGASSQPFLQQPGLQQQGWGAGQFGLGMSGSSTPASSPHGSCLQLNLLAQQQHAAQSSSAGQSPPMQASPTSQPQQPTRQVLQQLQAEQQQQSLQPQMGACTQGMLPQGGGLSSMYGMAQSLPSLKLGVGGGMDPGGHPGQRARAVRAQPQEGSLQGGAMGGANLMLGGTPVEGLLDWAAYLAPDGRTYYHNAKTGISTWDRPTRDDYGLQGFGGQAGCMTESSMLRRDSASSFHQF